MCRFVLCKSVWQYAHHPPSNAHGLIVQSKFATELVPQTLWSPRLVPNGGSPKSCKEISISEERLEIIVSEQCLSLNRVAGSRIYWDNMQNV